MIYGFTGTQRGATSDQLESLKSLVKRLKLNPSKDDWHHGDCIEADEKSHNIVKDLTWTVCHPPTDESKSAYCQCDEYRKPRDYILRNHDIVDESKVIIAMPYRMIEQWRSGTWATVRYARKLNRPIYIIWPTGKITRENMS